MKVLVVGLGALGATFSCLLQEKGHQVSALDREEVVRNITDRRVEITGIWGDHCSQLDAITADTSDLSSHYDLIIITVKSFDTARAVASIKGQVGPNTRIILAQNGFGNYEAAGTVIDRHHLIVGRVIFGAETIASGRSKVTVIADDVILGSPEKFVPFVEVEKLAQNINQAGIPCRASEEVMKYMWGKIIYNSALNSLGAILETNYGKLAEMEFTHQCMNTVIQEIFEVLKAMNEEVFWPDAASYLEDFYSKLVPPTVDHFPSMLQDIQRGRPTEIDALNGAICKLGRTYGVPTPVNDTITRLVKSKEIMRIG